MTTIYRSNCINFPPFSSIQVANLCDFQYRFSVPMELPFGFGRDLEQKLPTPRPIKELVRWKVAYPIPDDLSPIGSQQDDDIIVDSDGRTYALAGNFLLQIESIE